MDIHSLTYFKKVAELQHITRASEELHVAQPSLSRTISRLEDVYKRQPPCHFILIAHFTICLFVVHSLRTFTM